MKKRLTRTEKQYLILGILSVIVIIVAFAVLYVATVRQVEHRYKDKLQEAETQISNNRRMAFVAKEDIPAGSQITSDNTIYTEVFSNIPSINFINEDDLGKIAAIDISSKSHILKDMIVDEKIADDLREEEYKLFTLNTNLKQNDIVDIRIMFPNGEDYIVLSKKSLKNLQLADNKCYLWLNESEIVSLSSAIVDAYLHKGTKIYTSKYVQPSLQVESQVTYIPNTAVIELMRKDTNIINIATQNLNEQARKELDSRLESFENENSESITTWDASNSATVDSTPAEESTDSSYSSDDVYTDDGINDEGDVEYVE